MSELLREEQRGGKVDQQQNRKHKSHCGDEIHGLPQLLTGLYVQKGHAEENDGVEKRDPA
jgi:hypothetical protein